MPKLLNSVFYAEITFSTFDRLLFAGDFQPIESSGCSTGNDISNNQDKYLKRQITKPNNHYHPERGHKILPCRGRAIFCHWPFPVIT